MEIQFDTTIALRKLRKAFNMLRNEGISAHMRFFCCKHCGAPSGVAFLPRPLVYTELRDELAFKEIGVLRVHFVDSEGDRAGCRALGDQVQVIFQMHGLEVEWDGNPEKPIMVMA